MRLTTVYKIFIRRVWEQRPSCLRPIQCCVSGITYTILLTYAIFVWHICFVILCVVSQRLLTSFFQILFASGDRHLAETIANVITSLPFIALGIKTPRQDTALVGNIDAKKLCSTVVCLIV